MKQIGTTTAGSILVEMSTQEYDALHQIQACGTAAKLQSPASLEAVVRMNHAEQVTYVGERLKKLNPKKKEAVINSIEAMFQFSGGIASSEIAKILATLEKQKFLTITPDGRVTYPET